MCDTIRHRGPDDDGVLTDRDFGFGMRRLSVVDIEGGHQPMQTGDGRYSVIFNGEIYNFLELRNELKILGHRFLSHCDTEVILEGFAAWREALWPKLEGMFAIALWDSQTRELFLVRDQLGIKPLYWTLQRASLAFGSELKTLGPVPDLDFSPDHQAIEQFVTLGAILAPRSIYRNVFKLAPGAELRIGPTGAPNIRRYWRLRLAPLDADTLSEAGWIEECRTRLLDTVKRHLIADVPIGAFLSGGVDSSAIVAAMSQLGVAPVRTFTIGFAHPRFDESLIAAEVARHLGCIHRDIQLQPADLPPMLDQLAKVYDEPFADESAIPTWLVSRLAREDVTVALSGDGGDELFAGYRRYRSERLLQWLKRIPGTQLALDSLSCLPHHPLGLYGPRWDHLLKLAHDSALSDVGERNLAKQYRTASEVLMRLWGDKLNPPAIAGYRRWAAELFGEDLPEDPLLTMLQADTTVWLPDDMLTKVDRASMAHSLEVRVPLLSHRFVEWAATVPISLKLRGDQGKFILRRAIGNWLPPNILDRPKQGFAVPISHWLKGPFGDHVLKQWTDSGLEDTGLFSQGAMHTLLREHRTGASDHSKIVFTLLMLAQWWPTKLESTKR
jgi:asparagine synthase (glutamine-hydrolysing)